MINVNNWGHQDRIWQVYVQLGEGAEWRTEAQSGKEREGVRVRVTAAVVGNLRSKTRDPDRHEECSIQCLCDFGARTHSGYRDKGILSGRHQVGSGERQLPEDKLCCVLTP